MRGRGVPVDTCKFEVVALLAYELLVAHTLSSLVLNY